MKKRITIFIAFILIVFLITSISATLENSVFGFSKDMTIIVIGSQNQDLGKLIGFALCEECAVTNDILDTMDQILPGEAQSYGFIDNIKSAALALAKQRVINELKRNLNPKDRIIIDNLQKVQPYIKWECESNKDT